MGAESEVDPVRPRLVHLPVHHVRLPDDLGLVVLRLVEPLIVEVDRDIERAKILDLLIKVLDTLFGNVVLRVTKILVNVVTGDEEHLDALVVARRSLSPDLAVVVPVQTVEASVLPVSNRGQLLL